MRDSLSPPLSLLSPPPPLLFGFHWKSFFFLCRFPSRAARPYTTCYLTPWSLHTKLVGAGKRPFSVFFFFDLLVLHRCVCASLCVCVFQYLHFSLAPAGETTVSPSFRESWPQQRKAMHRRKRLNSKIRYGWAFLSPPRILITPLTCAAPPLCLANTGFICMTRCSDFFHRLEWCAEGRNVYNLVLWARLKRLDRESFVEVKG